MRYFSLLVLSVGILFSGCKDDQVDGPVFIENVLNHDSENESAPQFDEGEHEAATRFTANDLLDYQGRFIEHVDFFLRDRPDFCEIRIYEGTENNAPVNLIYDFDFSDLTNRDSWNRHVLTTPLEVLNDDLWIVVRMDASSPRNLIGCDAGPARANGDWLYTARDNDWERFRNRTQGAVSVNWNIRAVLNEL